jgi:hypothetical protein
MLKFTSFKRQEINLVFKIKVFVVSKIWYFNKSIYFYFPKIWVVTKGHRQRWTEASSHVGGTARGWAAPPWCVGPLLSPSDSSSDLWKLLGKIRLQELVSSNSENISCVALLKHKNNRKQGTGTVATC